MRLNQSEGWVWDYYHGVSYPAHCPPEWSFPPAVVLSDERGVEYAATIPMATGEQAKAWAKSLNAWQNNERSTR